MKSSAAASQAESTNSPKASGYQAVFHETVGHTAMTRTGQFKAAINVALERNGGRATFDYWAASSVRPHATTFVPELFFPTSLLTYPPAHNIHGGFADAIVAAGGLATPQPTSYTRIRFFIHVCSYCACMLSSLYAYAYTYQESHMQVRNARRDTQREATHATC